MDKSYLFVCGCPRSGTTTIVQLLNVHSLIAIGMERYKYYARKNKISKINSGCFEQETFFDIQKAQTNIIPTDENNWKKFYDSLRKKFTDGERLIVGDKYPQYFRFFNELKDNFENPKFVFMLRNINDVAFSYNSRAENPHDSWPEKNNYIVGVNHWNESLVKTWQYLKKAPESVFVCQYERIFSGDETYLGSLVDFLKINLEPGMLEYYRTITKDWEKRLLRSKNLDEVQLEYINKNAKLKLRDSMVKKYCR